MRHRVCAGLQEVLTLTLRTAPDGVTHWSAVRMAQEVDGLSYNTVRNICRRHGLMPHGCRQFWLSNDPRCAEKVQDAIGLYVTPPDHALVLSIDEKAQIQALARPQASRPMKAGQSQGRTLDYKRHRTMTLFAALEIRIRQAVGQFHDRHRHRGSVEFLDHVAAGVPADQEVHAMLDNYAIHKHAWVHAWLASHPNQHFHIVPTASSGLNAVEGFFAKLSRRCL